MTDQVRWKFVGYAFNGLPQYEIIDTEKKTPSPLQRLNEPVLGTRGDKHDERE